MIYTLDFDGFSRGLDGFKLDPEKEKREKRKMLFVNVTERWQGEEDIDYSIALDDMVDMLYETTDFVKERVELGDRLERLSQSITGTRCVRVFPRLL